ncbi:hypothetical protein [Pseudonocardia xishanensis]|uniref:hypothetical protein n=1 Tax=Pseudonocardia xishanensis TaxID=630995 RepID=UPI0031E53E43
MVELRGVVEQLPAVARLDDARRQACRRRVCAKSIAVSIATAADVARAEMSSSSSAVKDPPSRLSVR